MDRRSFMTSGALTVAASAASVSAAAAAPNRNAIAATGFPAPNLGSVREALRPLAVSDELVVTTPQPVYVLPRDHKFHSGQFYAANHFWEWHYWSGFCKDAAGNEYAMFFGTDPVGYDPKTGGFAFLPAVISISPIKEGKKYYYFNNFPDFKPSRPKDSTSPADFQYDLRNDEAGWTVDERYYADQERWVFRMKSRNPTDPWCDLDIRLGEPGYVPRTPTGIEEEGFGEDGRYNPQTMDGLSYYYIAPNMPFSANHAGTGSCARVAYGGSAQEVARRAFREAA